MNPPTGKLRWILSLLSAYCGRACARWTSDVSGFDTNLQPKRPNPHIRNIG